jgi:FAD/FMN-containing dehydrogenase
MSSDLFQTLQQLLGTGYVLPGDASQTQLTDKQGTYVGKALALVRPANTEEVAAVVRACVAHKTPIVVQGGNTGLMGAATPDASGRSVLLLLDRLNRVRQVDTDNDTLTVEAGCILQNVQDVARDAGRLFPLSLGAEGSCTIGGNLGTNAGGTAVLRYGNTRELTLGLEVVTAEGEIWNGLRGLRKDNTGYDLRDLYIGSEGTLGIITAVTLKLFPLPKAQSTAFLAFDSLGQAVSFLSHARAGFGASLTAFELLTADCLALLREQFPEGPQPFLHAPQPWFALLELSDNHSEAHARQAFEDVLGSAFEEDLLADAPDRRKPGPKRSFVAAAGKHERGAEASGAQHEARHFDSDLAHRRVRRAHRRIAPTTLSRRAQFHLRPPGRRQPALQRRSSAEFHGRGAHGALRRTQRTGA